MRALPLLVFSGWLAACGSDSNAPSATVKSVTPDQITMSDDTANDVELVVDYSDHDGDLGDGVAEVHDCRADALVTSLAIPPIAPAGASDPISGELDLYVTDIGPVTSSSVPQTCSDLGVATLDPATTVLCVILVDAKGHRGPGDCSLPITLMP